MLLALADKSAYEQRRHSSLARDWFERAAASGLLAVCEIVALEILYSARNLTDYQRLQHGLNAQPWLAATTEVLQRALEVQHALAKRGQHRTSLPDLALAATAEIHEAVLVHYDSDFDRIAAITGQQTQWVGPRGAAG